MENILAETNTITEAPRESTANIEARNHARKVTEVHLVFKTHLDVGFTDFARNVKLQYFDHFIPQAIERSRTMNESGATERFRWTTGSWLIYAYLEEKKGRERALMEQAILNGDIVWHALPFTTHSELMPPFLFRHGLSLSRRLDERFGRKTIAAKMTDVPGHTRGIVNILAEEGVRFLHIGVNAACTPPRVPPVFKWRTPTGAEVAVMYKRGGYGDLVYIPEMCEELCISHTNDNCGPQSPEEIRAIYRRMRRKFPQARVFASTLDAFAERLIAQSQALPVIEGELGDTWIHGVGSDPAKVARYRQLCRLAEEWTGPGKDTPPHVDSFLRTLMMVPEHTWGLDEKVHLADFENYSRPAFEAHRGLPNFRKMEASWQEQRDYVNDAVKLLGDSPEGRMAGESLRAILPARPDTSRYTEIEDRDRAFEAGAFNLQFSPTGAIERLVERQSRRTWATPRHPIGEFHYEVYDERHFARFYRRYSINKKSTRDWAVPDLTKPGMAEGVERSQRWTATARSLHHRAVDGADCFLLRLEFETTACNRFGAPAEAFIEYTVHHDRPAIGIELQWFNKPACRIAEASWLTFCPVIRNAGSWSLEKMGELIDPREVVQDGNRRLHAVQNGVMYRDSDAALHLYTLDAPLIAPGQSTLLDFNNRLPSVRNGMHCNLHNNMWGTNFPMWYEDDGRFRFLLEFRRPG